MFYSKDKGLKRRKFTDLSTSSGREFEESGMSFKQKFDKYTSSRTPKERRKLSLFQRRKYTETRQNDQSDSMSQRETESYRKPRINRHGTFEYESVNMISGKNSSLRISKEEDRNDNIQAEPSPQKYKLYRSIQTNLTQCDKILSKLKNVTVGCNKSPTKQTFKNQSLYEGEKQPKREQKTEQRQRIYSMQQPIIYTHITSKPLQQSLYPTFSLSDTYNKSQKQQQLIKDPSYLYPIQQESVIDLRRKRINEIIKKRKDSIKNPLDESLARMRARGENMFSKMVRTRQKSTGNIDILQEW